MARARSTWRILLVIVIAASTAFSSFPNDDGSSCSSPENDEQQRYPRCTLYLAESSIPNAGLGIYSGIRIDENETLNHHLDDVVIPIYDIELHNDYQKIKWLISDYSWTAPKLGVEMEAKRVTALAPGLGALANNHHALRNIAFYGSPSNDNEAGRRRNKIPGVTGSATPYHHLKHYATMPIETGSELFHDYGERWGEKRVDKIGPIPLKSHYREADSIIACFKQFLDIASLSIHDDIAKGVWKELRLFRNVTEDMNFVSQLGIQSRDVVKSLEEVVVNSSSCQAQDIRTEVALNFPYNFMVKAIESGSARASLPKFIQSLRWLEENGRCIDGLSVGASYTIPHGGRGAFATRNFLVGDIITTAPLLQLNRSMLETYQFSMNHPGKQRKLSSQKLGRQLLWNYCYGHHDSSMLFFPYSNAVNMLNHGGNEGANARIEWSTFSWHQHDWLRLSTKELLNKSSSGLIFDIVATKPIHSGDEIFLDYGRDWEEEWQKHDNVKSWNPSALARKQPQDYDVATAASNIHNDLDILPSRQEGEEQDANLETWCRFDNLKATTHPVREGTVTEKDLTAFEEIVREGWVERRWHLGNLNNETVLSYHSAKLGRPCRIIARRNEQGQTCYTVATEKRGTTGPPKGWILVTNVPREVMYCRNKPYTSEIHLPQAVRSFIGIPDEIFPAAWRDMA